MKTVLNRINVDTTKQPIFLGEGLALQRYDKFKYPKFFELYQDQVELFWRPEEVSVMKDRNDFKSLTETEKFIFISNLKYQTLMDSVIGRGIDILKSYTSLPEVEACFNAWQYFENIHSYSYTYLIKNVFSDPGEIFDSILTDEEIMKRASSVSGKYDELLKSDGDIKTDIYLALISTNILEGIRFYVSFACGWYFAEQGKMEGNAKILKLISRDENKHVAITQNLIRILRENPEEGFQDVIKANEERVIKMFSTAVEEEKTWARYLFSRGQLLGFNDKVACGYIEWLANNRLRSIGLKGIYDAPHNPIGGWISNWTDSSKVQVAPQEAELESYKVSSFTPLSGNEDYGDITL